MYKWTIIYNNYIMIQEPWHSHSDNSKREQSTEPQNHLAIFDELLNQSLQLLGEQSNLEVVHALQNKQQRVYLSYANSPIQYLAHFLSSHSQNTNDEVSQLLQNSQNIVVNKLTHQSQYQVNIKPSLGQIRQSIKDKIQDLKSGISNMSIEGRSSPDINSGQFTDNYMQFRRKGYWNQKSEKNQNVRRFLHKMKHQQLAIRKRYEESLEKQQQQIKEKTKQQKIQMQQQRRKLCAQSVEINQEKKNKRYQQNTTDQNKKQQIAKFLSKYRTTKPIYITNQQKFKKEYLEEVETERVRKIKEIRNNRQPIDPEQIEQHIQKYENYKQKLEDEKQKKEKGELQMLSKLQQQLKLLYHSKFHQELLERRRGSAESESSRGQFRKKVEEYKQNVVRNFKPKIDPKKRLQMQQKVKELSLLEDKTKVKRTVAGQTIFEDKPIKDHRQVGKQYLAMLHHRNQGITPKKASMQQRSISLLELHNKEKFKKIDYLRQNKPKLVLKSTLSQWKKVLNDQKYTPKDKYVSVMNHVSVLEQKARQKQVQLKNTKNQDKAIDIKEQMDKLYLESVGAKMVVLRDVILKQ